MKKHEFKATTLRLILMVTILFIVCTASAGFYFAKNYLVNFATEVDNNSPTKTNVEQGTQTVDSLRKDIESHKAIATKANKILAPSQGYETLIISDLKKFATKNNIQISEYTFSQLNANDNTLTTIPGAQIAAVKITLGNPITYTSFVMFLKDVENNLPKMQVRGIAITRDTTSSNSITVEPITIESYVGSTQ
jgi:hypothetical protein